MVKAELSRKAEAKGSLNAAVGLRAMVDWLLSVRALTSVPIVMVFHAWYWYHAIRAWKGVW